MMARLTLKVTIDMLLKSGVSEVQPARLWTLQPAFTATTCAGDTCNSTVAHLPPVSKLCMQYLSGSNLPLKSTRPAAAARGRSFDARRRKLIADWHICIYICMYIQWPIVCQSAWYTSSFSGYKRESLPSPGSLIREVPRYIAPLRV